MLILQIDHSYLIQTIIVAVIVAGALGGILYKLLKPHRKGTDGDCSCCALSTRCNSPKNHKSPKPQKSPSSPGPKA